ALTWRFPGGSCYRNPSTSPILALLTVRSADPHTASPSSNTSRLTSPPSLWSCAPSNRSTSGITGYPQLWNRLWITRFPDPTEPERRFLGSSTTLLRPVEHLHVFPALLRLPEQLAGLVESPRPRRQRGRVGVDRSE